MDANKAQELRAIGYKLYRTCARCKHSAITRGTQWGVCHQNTYFHLKHKKVMPLSINASGSCPNFEQDPADNIHGFKEFEVEENGN